MAQMGAQVLREGAGDPPPRPVATAGERSKGEEMFVLIIRQHGSFGHTRGVCFSRPSKFTILYIWRPLIGNFARYVFGL